MRKVYTILFLLASLPTFVMSQTWEPVVTEGIIVIEKRIEQCTNERGTVYEYVFLKFSNTSNVKVNITFQLATWLDGKFNNNLADGETEKSLTIPADGFVEADCDAKLGTLKIYSKLISMEGGSELTNFEVQDIVVH